MPFTALAIGAGAGLLKSVAIDGPRESRQRQLAAATQRYSPWTGLKADSVQEADPLGSALQFGATGAQLGANIQNSKAQTDWLNRGGSPQYTSQLTSSASSPRYGSFGPASPWDWNAPAGAGIIN